MNAVGRVSDSSGTGQRVVSDSSQHVDGLSRTWTDADGLLGGHAEAGPPRVLAEGAPHGALGLRGRPARESDPLVRSAVAVEAFHPHESVAEIGSPWVEAHDHVAGFVEE